MDTLHPKNDPPTSLFIHFWDGLLWLLVIFPFLTGGLWLSRPGVFIELSDVGIPVLIVTVLGLIAQCGLGLPLEKATAVRFGHWFWNRWNQSLKNCPARTLGATTLLMGSIGAYASLRRHWAFGSHAFDLGIFTNTIWNLTHGHGYFSSIKGGINLFADHQSPIFWSLAPLFALFPYPETLLLVQAFTLAAGGLFCFYAGRQFSDHTTSWIPAALPWLYWLYLPFRNANAFDFHPEVLMLPLFLGTITGLQSAHLRSRIWGSMALLLALGAKESAGPVAAGIGLAWLLGAGPARTRPFTRRAGILLGILGAAVFVFDVRVVPRLLAISYAYQGMFAQYGATFSEILLAPIHHPGLFFKQLFGPERLRFLAWTLGPLAFIPLARPRAFVAALPGYLMLFLSTGAHRINLEYHYAIEPGVGLFFAMPGALFALTEIRKIGPCVRILRFLPLWILFWALGMSGRSEFFRIRKFTSDTERTQMTQWMTEKVIPCLNPTVPLVASETLVPHLATRRWIQAEDLSVPLEVGCWITVRDWSHWPLSSATEALRQIPFDFKEVWRCGGTSVFERSSPNPPCLKCQPSCDYP